MKIIAVIFIPAISDCGVGLGDPRDGGEGAASPEKVLHVRPLSLEIG
jgi:hypothetical protein